MPQLSLFFGLLLSILGVSLYFITDQTSWTALIPALFFGMPLLVLGLIGRNEKARMHAMHVAAMVGLLGTAGGLGMGLPKILKGTAGPANIGQAGMGLLSLIFVILCVRSFIEARKAKSA